MKLFVEANFKRGTDEVSFYSALREPAEPAGLGASGSLSTPSEAVRATLAEARVRGFGGKPRL